ncbi:MAG: DUF2793 domain-containing protein [Pseudoxanthomonas sp.]|nr:MAG: DUF2793 domain-containing protein [Pseudoxanthomonas sp.]
MSDPILPFAVWQSGTNQNSIPANDNALRSEILNGLVISESTDSQPGSPARGDIYIMTGSASGTQWATFDQYDLAIYDGAGTWHAYAPVEGIVVNVAGTLKRWNGTAYELVAGLGDAPSDGTGYVRKDGAWVAETAAANRYVNVALSDMTTDITTGTAKAVWFAPEDGTLASVYIGVHDPSSSGVVRVDMNDSGGSVFTTRPAIDATEATSLTGTAAVLDGTVSFVRGDKFTFDIDDAGTDAKGLQACIEYAPA